MSLKIFCTLISVLFIVFSGCVPESATKSPIAETAPSAASWYSVYFTTPQDPAASTLRGGPDAALVEAIDQAVLSVDIAAYSLDLWSVRDALLRAHRRGVAVRLVVESDNRDSDELVEIAEAGVPVLGDRREGLMHNKFAVIDRYEVWTGSMNFTVNGAYRNFNNLLRVRSSRLAENYLAEFEEMYIQDMFGPGSPADTPFPSHKIDSTQIETYFSPDDHVSAHIIDTLQGAESSIQFLVFSFTSDEIAATLIERAAHGVNVQGVLDSGQVSSNLGGEYDNLQQGGVAVRRDSVSGKTHHKVFIIDGRTVVTGSYNMSHNAETLNDENILIIHNADIAAQYTDEFVKLYGSAVP